MRFFMRRGVGRRHSLMTERTDRIHSGCATCRHEAGSKRDGDETRRHRGHHSRIERANPIECALDVLCENVNKIRVFEKEDSIKFFIVGGLPSTHTSNYMYDCTDTFHFVRRHEIASGQTLKGIQTVCRMRDGMWWFGCYGQPAVTLITNDASELKAKKIYNSAVGIARSRNDGVLLIGKDRLVGEMHAGSVSRVSVASILSAKNAPKDAR